MKIIVCVDDNNGISFFGKRQSMDIVQRNYLSNIVGDSIIYLSPYSFELYSDLNLNFKVIEDFTEIREGYFLYEGEYLEKITDIDEIILFKWNRSYPFDKTFEKHESNEFKIKERHDFVGKSHEKITFERYVVKNE